MSQISSTQNSKRNLYSLVLCAILIALSFVLGMVKIIPMPYGGSITLFSMLAATLTGYFCGPKWGLTSGVALGLLNLIIDPVILFPLQVLSNKKNGLYIGYIVAIIGRFICSFLSGFLFFGEYAPEGMNPVWYSFLYNIFYIGGEGVLTLLVLALPPVKNTIFRLKKERFQ